MHFRFKCGHVTEDKHLGMHKDGLIVPMTGLCPRCRRKAVVSSVTVIKGKKTTLLVPKKQVK